MKLGKKQDRTDIDRFYNRLEDWLVLLATQRACDNQRLVFGEESKLQADVEFTLNSGAVQQANYPKKTTVNI